MKRRRPVLVPIFASASGSFESAAALPIARAMASSEQVPLIVGYVADCSLSSEEVAARLSAIDDQLGEAKPIVLAGDPAQAIVDAAHDSALIVLAARLHSPESDALDPIAATVLHSAPCPVLIVPAERGLAPWTLRRALLPLDGAPSTATAIRPSCAFADHAGATLLALHVAEPKPPLAEAGSLPVPVYVDQPQYEWSAWGDEFIRRILYQCGLVGGARLHVYLAVGEPGPEIVRFASAEAVDLMLVAWRGSLAAKRGATLATLLRDAPCPVLVTRFAEAKT